MQRLRPVALCVFLAACGQQAPPEASADRAPPDNTPAVDASSAQPASAAQQAGRSPVIDPASGSDENPTGRGQMGDAGRGQGPAPGEAGHPVQPTSDRCARITPEEAAADCDRLAEPHRQECLNTIQRGVKIEAARDARED